MTIYGNGNKTESPPAQVGLCHKPYILASDILFDRFTCSFRTHAVYVVAGQGSLDIGGKNDHAQRQIIAWRLCGHSCREGLRTCEDSPSQVGGSSHEGAADASNAVGSKEFSRMEGQSQDEAGTSCGLRDLFLLFGNAVTRTSGGLRTVDLFSCSAMSKML